MSHEKFKGVEQLHAAFGKGDIPTVLEGVFMRIGEAWDGFSVAPAEFLAAGDSVVALGHYSGTHRVTAQKVCAQFAEAVG